MATVKQIIWGFLLQELNGNEYGAAAVMGNMRGESGFVPNNLENSFEPYLNLDNESYTAKFDSGAWGKAEFAKRWVWYKDDGTIAKQGSAGYGLCQWTYPSRKERMFDYWKKYTPAVSIGDLEMQCRWFVYECKTWYSGVWDKLLNATEISEPTIYFMVVHENPYNQSTSAKNKRVGYAQAIYDEFHGTTGAPFPEVGDLIDPDTPYEPDVPDEPYNKGNKMDMMILILASKRRRARVVR